MMAGISTFGAASPNALNCSGFRNITEQTFGDAQVVKVSSKPNRGREKARTMRFVLCGGPMERKHVQKLRRGVSRTMRPQS
jgi:hypothetical protein